MFPDKSRIHEHKILDINALVFATLPLTNNPKRDSISVLWGTREDCVSLNLTDLSKKISKVLQKKNVNESMVTVDIQIGAVLERSSIPEDSARAVNRDLCSALVQRQSNDSFLIIKNYNEATVPRLVRDTSYSGRRRRDVSSQEYDHQETHQQPNNVTGATEKAVRTCELVPLVVNLTETYGTFIKAPILADIKDCAGRCALMLDGEVFSKRGALKERLKLLPGREYLSSYEPSCTPIRFKPLHLLISLENSTSEVIVQMSDLVADQCKCL